jgi:hypothetical protein
VVERLPSKQEALNLNPSTSVGREPSLDDCTYMKCPKKASLWRPKVEQWLLEAMAILEEAGE